MNQLVELDENQWKSFDHLVQNQGKIKGMFDKGARQKEFQKGDLVLMWNKKSEKSGKHGKFDSLWFGPY